jgi:hypothetical protein
MYHYTAVLCEHSCSTQVMVAPASLLQMHYRPTAPELEGSAVHYMHM